MTIRVFSGLILSVSISGLGLIGHNSMTAAGAAENIDATERMEATSLRPSRDPIQDEIYAFRLRARQAYNSRSFDELEKMASALRSSKETFGNGSWKIAQFYQAFACREDEPESMWTLHQQIHRDWITAKPASVTAQVAYADFLTDYAWRARGSGYVDSVTEEGWRLFRERMASARAALDEARKLKEKDPYLWLVGLEIARGQEWSKAEYDSWLTEAKSIEPKFWGYDTERAFSLLPRWYGKPGEWEAYAEEASARPDGLGAETYARIVIHLRGYHENIFTESKASWPKVRDGLAEMRKKYPTSLEIVSHSALLATMGQDRALAKAMFDQLGDTYLPGVWRRPERFVHFRTWARTGQW